MKIDCLQPIILLPVVDHATDEENDPTIDYFASSRSVSDAPVSRIGLVAMFRNTSIQIRLPPPPPPISSRVRRGGSNEAASTRSRLEVRIGGTVYGYGDSFRVSLNDYETLAITGGIADGDDLTGTTIRSNRPLHIVAVVASDRGQRTQRGDDRKSIHQQITHSASDAPLPAGPVRDAAADQANRTDGVQTTDPQRSADGAADGRAAAAEIFATTAFLQFHGARAPDASSPPSASAANGTFAGVTYGVDVVEKTENFTVVQPTIEWHGNESYFRCSNKLERAADKGIVRDEVFVLQPLTDKHGQETYVLLTDEDDDWFQLSGKDQFSTRSA
jgi:hypothetical protein